MGTHTPGPWTVEEYGDEDAPALVIHKNTETRVCFMATPGSHGDPAKIEADAHLIAAAPELLAALKQLVADYQDVPDPTDEDGQAVFDTARAAIAKAEGSEKPEIETPAKP